MQKDKIQLIEERNNESPYADEERIVWLEDPTQWRYLRQNTAYCRTRKGPPLSLKRSAIYKLVGYAELKPCTKGPVFRRRFWWLKDYDAGCPNELEDYKKDRRPAEAVNPENIRIGASSHFRSGDQERVGV